MLSTLEPSTDGAGTPRGLLRMGGRSVVQHQLGVALALGCERVICLADGLPGEVIALQHAAERGGASFQVAADGRALARLVRPDDELLVFADGVVASSEAVSTLLGGRSGLVVQPVESGVAAGYERIDLNHAGAGILRLPGRLAAGLAELPEEWNPVSALLRIAVQSSLRQVVLPQALVGSGNWTLIRSDAEAHRLEPQWLRRHTENGGGGGPARWLAARLVEWLGPALLHAGTRPSVLTLGAGALALIALLAAWFGAYPAAFVGLGVAWLTRRGAAILARVHGERAPARPAWFDPEAAFDLALDGAFAAAIAWRFTLAPSAPSAVLHGAFIALTLLGLLRLMAAVFSGRRWKSWLEDRLVLAAALAGASLSVLFDVALMAGVLGVLALGLAAAHEPRPGAAEPEDGAPRAPERLTPP
ncbi:MAG: hypothetical protein LC648_00925 [Novosphingobium sp.]|nr:hypothetical protein [Novosphingobium sp.]